MTHSNLTSSCSLQLTIEFVLYVVCLLGPFCQTRLGLGKNRLLERVTVLIFTERKSRVENGNMHTRIEKGKKRREREREREKERYSLRVKG